MKRPVVSLSLLFAASVLVSATHAAARESFDGGHVVGNGGNVTVCHLPSGSDEVTLFDYFEARTIFSGFQLRLGDPSLPVEEKLNLVFDALSAQSPRRAKEYRERANRLLASDPFVNGPLDPIPDSQHLGIVLPPNCHIEQAAMQIDSPVSPSDKQYFFNRPLWLKLDNDSRAGLILHEVIYTDALRFGQKNSINVRKINSHFASGVAFQMTDRDFFELFARAGFGALEVRGVAIEEWTRVGYAATTFYADGSLESAPVADGSSVSFSQAGTKVTVHVKGEARFYDKGPIESVLLSQPARLRGARGTRLFGAGTYLKLSKTGLVNDHYAVSF